METRSLYRENFRHIFSTNKKRSPNKSERREKWTFLWRVSGMCVELRLLLCKIDGTVYFQHLWYWQYEITIHGWNAMLRMVYYNQQNHSCYDAMTTLLGACEGSTITLESFIDLVVTDNSIIQPAFDIQLRIIEKTTGDGKVADGKGCWDLYRERRGLKFTSEFPDIKCNGKSISSSARFESADESCELSIEFISSLFQRVERHINAPDGFDSWLKEERYVDKLRDALVDVATTVSCEDFSIDRVEERKELRKRLWSLIDEIKVTHLELERDLGIWDRNKLSEGVDGANPNQPLEYTSTGQTYRFIQWQPECFCWWLRGQVWTNGNPLGETVRPDQNLSFYFQWQTGERCYDQQVGNQPVPAIGEICDCLIELTDYKCFNCDAPRSERNKKKYRGRVSLENMEVE